MFLWSFCDGFFGFPAIGFLICGSSIPGLVPAGVLELIEQLISSYTYWNYSELSLLRLGVLLWSNKWSWSLIESLTIQKFSGWVYPLIFDFSMADIHRCSCRHWIMWLNKLRLMGTLFIIVLHILVCTIGQCQSNISHFDDSEITFNLKAQPARNHQFMPIRASGPAVVQALGFKCIICDGEFASKHAADCHRRQPAFIGTKCAEPRSIRSLSLTERPDVSVGILRHHSAVPLGQSMYILYEPFSHVKHKLVHIFQ